MVLFSLQEGTFGIHKRGRSVLYHRHPFDGNSIFFRQPNGATGKLQPSKEVVSFLRCLCLFSIMARHGFGDV